METRVLHSVLVIGFATALGLASGVSGAERSDRPSDRGKEGSAERSRDRTDGSRFSDRSRKSQWERGKEELARALKPGEERDFYRKELSKLGYQITSVNQDKPDYLEYEVVKGDQTYEIQLDLDKSSRKATKVEISTNMWKADVTDQILKGRKPNKKESSGPGNARYSDRGRRSDWEKGRDELARGLKNGEERDFYRKELEKLGYQITSVNSEKPEYIEYEVVKGDQTYEIQIDMDKSGRKATKVDVAANVWMAQATERALESRRARSESGKKEAADKRRSAL